MNKIYTTGDTHGTIDIHKLSAANFPEGNTLTKKDVLIVTGDFGLIWNNDKTDLWWQKWLAEKPWTTVFVDGNHENHKLLSELKTVKKFGSDVGKVNDSIFHLRRGRVYKINGEKILTIGGAESIDKEWRVEGVSWWPEELISRKEEDQILDLLAHDTKFDYVITHTVPKTVFDFMFPNSIKYNDPTMKLLDYVNNVIEFKAWYFGHFHDNISYGKYHCVYDEIIRIK